MKALAITQQTQDDGRRSLVFKLARRRYAIGLVWLATANEDTVEKDARKGAADHASDLFVIRRTDSGAQYGIGRKSDGLQAGAISAAAAISDQIRGSFCAIFQIAGGWWFVSQRDDLITPHGDAFYDDEEAARARLREAIDEGSWTEIIAPAEWALSDTRSLDAAEALMLAKSPKLRSVSALTSYIIPAGIAMFAAGAIYFGVSTYLSYQQEQERQVEAAKIQEELKKKLAEEARKKVQKEPWPDFARAADVIAGCATEFARIEPLAPGWFVDKAECDVKGKDRLGAKWEWRRIYGGAAWLDVYLADTYGQDIADSTRYDTDGNKASTASRGAKLTERGKENLAEERRIVIDLLSLAQGTGAELKLGKLEVPQPPEGTKAEDWTPPPYGWMKWELKTLGLDGWAAQLDRFPGLVVDTIQFDPSRNGYVLKGDIYVQR